MLTEMCFVFFNRSFKYLEARSADLCLVQVQVTSTSFSKENLPAASLFLHCGGETCSFVLKTYFHSCLHAKKKNPIHNLVSQLTQFVLMNCEQLGQNNMV